MKSRLRTIYTPWTPGLQPTWTVAQVRSALTAHEAGDFSSSAQLIDAMGRSERLCAVDSTRLGQLFGSDFHLEPEGSEEADAKAKAMAEELEEDWWQCCPEAELRTLWRWRLYAGVAFAEKQWRGGDSWKPTIRCWHPQHVYADEDEGVYRLNAREGQVDIPFGGDHKWIVLGTGMRPWMGGLVRSLAIPWLIEQWAERDWARYSERHGMPIVKAMVPVFADEGDKEDFFDDVKALSTETTVQLPTHMGTDGAGFDLGLVEATANTWEGFKELLRHVHDTYAIALTGNNLTTLIEGGSYAASSEASTRLYDLAKADAEELSTTLRSGLLVQWAGYNYADAEDYVPWPTWDTEPPEDVKAKAETIRVAGEALNSLKAAGYEPDDIDAFSEQFGVRLVRIEVDEPDDIDDNPPPQEEEPEDVDDDGPQDDVDERSRKVRRSMHTLASGDSADSAKGFVDGQLFADDIIDEGIRRSRKFIRADLAKVLDAVNRSDDYPTLRDNMRALWPDLDPRPFANLMQKALVLADLAGRHAVSADS